MVLVAKDVVVGASVVGKVLISIWLSLLLYTFCVYVCTRTDSNACRHTSN